MTSVKKMKRERRPNSPSTTVDLVWVREEGREPEWERERERKIVSEGYREGGREGERERKCKSKYNESEELITERKCVRVSVR